MRSPYYDITDKKKAEITKGILLRQLGRLGLLRPVAFRPPLAKGLALSKQSINIRDLKSCQCFSMVYFKGKCF